MSIETVLPIAILAYISLQLFLVWMAIALFHSVALFFLVEGGLFTGQWLVYTTCQHALCTVCVLAPHVRMHSYIQEYVDTRLICNHRHYAIVC